MHYFPRIASIQKCLGGTTMREDNVYVFTTTKIMFPLTRSQKEEGINISDIFLQSKLTFFLKFIKRPTNQLFSTCRRGRKKISFIFLLLKSIELHHHVYYTMNITQNTILSILYTITNILLEVFFGFTSNYHHHHQVNVLLVCLSLHYLVHLTQMYSILWHHCSQTF